MTLMMQKSPETAFLFGFLAVITGVELLLLASGTHVPEIALIILGIFWIVTGLLAFWFGYRYWMLR